MPATTALSVVPAGRPRAEVGLAAIPGYYLSSAVSEDPQGAAVRQASLVVEPDEWLGVPGLLVGARAVGSDDIGVYGEPMLGYRHAFGDAGRLSLGAVGFGTKASASENHASYEATRIGAELGGDLRITPKYSVLELHVLLGGSLTALDASGNYCLDAGGRHGVDCPDESPVRSHASASGFYPALNAGLAFDLAQHLDLAFHGARLAFLYSGGFMPRVVSAEQVDPEPYGSFGLALTLYLGSPARERNWHPDRLKP
jgi:hypothetical protein